MSKKRQAFYNDFIRFKRDVGFSFRLLRRDAGKTAQEVQEALDLRTNNGVQKIEQGYFDCIFPLLKVCRYYGKRPVIKFINLTREENALFNREENA